MEGLLLVRAELLAVRLFVAAFTETLYGSHYNVACQLCDDAAYGCDEQRLNELSHRSPPLVSILWCLVMEYFQRC